MHENWGHPSPISPGGVQPQTSIPGATTGSVFKLDEVLTLYLLMMSAGVILELAEFHSSSF